ncbi:receptor activity-modifying protein 2 [Carettochelys insculpta]|uniref:receptor activity-modifying protein 2 n=1 Tax=Carettochelys insculpta TaxID=44489 RepID=UPI003EC0AA6D
MALCRETRSGRLSPRLLLLLLLWATLRGEAQPTGAAALELESLLDIWYKWIVMKSEKLHNNLSSNVTEVILGTELPPTGTAAPEAESLVEFWWKWRVTETEQLHNRSLFFNVTGATPGSEHPPAGTAAPKAESLAESWVHWIQVEQQHHPNLFSNMTNDAIYEAVANWCWVEFLHWMRNVPSVQLCEWRVISRPYSNLRHCLETLAEKLHYSEGYPNSMAEEFIIQSHCDYFLNCTQEHPVFLDPPEDLLLALITAPICLIPFLVTLVVWRSKDGKMQA